mmetsp:Transcript_51998/g.97271  ORF Transcript_51998/g.97271 Transcript_51998/m.97271 type:complete len:223 (+) Transcript_51998:20-688(+)
MLPAMAILGWLSGFLLLLCSAPVASEAPTAVHEIKDGADMTNLLAEPPKVMLMLFHNKGCGYCQQLMPGYEEAARKLHSLNSSVKLAATSSRDLLQSFDVKLVPCVFLLVNGEIRYRVWAWDFGDVFDFARTFDTTIQPVGYIFRNYYWLRSLYKFGVQAVMTKMLKMSKQHPLQIWLPQLLAPLIMFALMLLLLIARCILACCLCCGKKKKAKKVDSKKQQ